jgi:Lon protease-like protein
MSYSLPLFPLGSVLFPGGLLALRIFEARYMDLMTACIKTGSTFGVVLLRKGGEVHGGGASPPQVESIGCQARLLQWDMAEPGLMLVRCRGLERFEVAKTRSGPNGLMIGDVRDVEADDAESVSDELAFASDALRHVIAAIESQQGDKAPFVGPFRFDDCAWVANRWCELLPIPMPLKQRLMALPDARARLELVAGFLRQRRIAGA